MASRNVLAKYIRGNFLPSILFWVIERVVTKGFEANQGGPQSLCCTRGLSARRRADDTQISESSQYTNSATHMPFKRDSLFPLTSSEELSAGETTNLYPSQAFSLFLLLPASKFFST
jgi:hypothetical protein